MSKPSEASSVLPGSGSLSKIRMTQSGLSITGGLKMTEKSIKEIMDERFGVGQIPRRKVSRVEMDMLIAEAKERGKTREKRSKHTEDTKKDDVEEPEKITCEFKCDICGEVIQFPGKDIEAAMKKAVPHREYDSSVQCDGIFKFERQVESISSISKQINEADKNMEDIYCEFKCDKCQTVVPARGKGLERAKSRTAIHEGCGGTFAFLRQINPDEIRKRSAVPRKDSAIIEKFDHPKSGKFICGGCYDLNHCLQTCHHMEICILINIDLKLKNLLIRLTELLEILSKNKMMEGENA